MILLFPTTSTLTINFARSKTESDFEIDVHGLYVVEAIEYCREKVDFNCLLYIQVARWNLGASYTKLKRYPAFKIITGVGSHSLNRDPVLYPRIKRALSKDGWVLECDSIQGYIMVQS